MTYLFSFNNFSYCLILKYLSVPAPLYIYVSDLCIINITLFSRETSQLTTSMNPLWSCESLLTGQLQPQINSLQLSRENQANAQISTKTTNEGTIRVSDHPSTSRFIPTIRNSTITFKSNFPFTRKIPFDVCHTWNAPAARLKALIDL